MAVEVVLGVGGEDGADVGVAAGAEEVVDSPAVLILPVPGK